MHAIAPTVRIVQLNQCCIFPFGGQPIGQKDVVSYLGKINEHGRYLMLTKTYVRDSQYTNPSAGRNIQESLSWCLDIVEVLLSFMGFWDPLCLKAYFLVQRALTNLHVDFMGAL